MLITNKKLIIFNGPPFCGKDLAAETVIAYLGSDYCSHLKFSQPLKDIVQGQLGISQQELELTKDEEVAYEQSYRDLQINIFLALSRVFDESWLGFPLSYNVYKDENDLIVTSDGGRLADIQPLLSVMPAEDIMIVQIMRDGCSFEKDIKTYISAVGVTMKHVYNTNIDTFKDDIINLAIEHFGD